MVNTFYIGPENPQELTTITNIKDLFKFTVTSLDVERCRSQCKEAKQIINTIMILKENPDSKPGYYHHPIVQLWLNHLEALKIYYNCFIEQALTIHKIVLQKLVVMEIDTSKLNEIPWFLTYPPFYLSHRARLLQKDPSHYSTKFSVPSIYLSIGYVWPVRHPPSYYIDLINQPEKVADDLNEKYINPIYCSAIFKTGKKKGQVCGRLLDKPKGNVITTCGIHCVTKKRKKTDISSLPPIMKTHPSKMNRKMRKNIIEFLLLNFK
jgi:hypothetical protein